MWRAALIAGTLAMTAVLHTADAAKPAGGFTLTSPDIATGRKMALAQVFNSFGCTGNNVSPALSWSHAPQGTQSFALLVHDPDAPTGSGWWHWVVYDIPATANLALRHLAGPDRLRQLRLWRPLPAAGEGAPLSLPALRIEGAEARGSSR